MYYIQESISIRYDLYYIPVFDVNLHKLDLALKLDEQNEIPNEVLLEINDEPLKNNYV
jgi:hypothetical protein